MLLALTPAAALADPAASVLAEEVVAVVETRSVLLGELEVEARLVRAGEQGAATLGQPLSSRELRDALDRLVDRLIVYTEAERLQVFDLAAGDVDRAVLGLHARLGAAPLDAFLASWDVDARTLAGIVQRELRVARYLDGRFRLAARPKETEVLAFFRDHADELQGRTFDQAAPGLRASLARERFQQLSEAFVADVRRRARVRVLRDFDAPGSETPKTGTASAAEVGRRGSGR